MISNTIHGPPVSADLLNASLRHVPDLGWSEETLNAGARDLNISSQEVSLLVPEGPIGLVHHFVRKSNQDLSSHPLLAERLHSHKKDNESNTGNEGNKSNESNESNEGKGGQTTDDQPIQSAAERLSIVSRTRLEMVVPYLEHGHWLNAMALSGLPENAEATSRLALETMDEIWCVAGDCSVDYKWYTRRAGFLPVYCATELYLLSDESNQYEETWGFLNSHVDSFFGGAAFQLNGGGVVRIKYGVTIRQRFNFRQFPFETQVLEINVQASPVFAGNGHTFTNGATHGEVILKDPTRYRYKSGHSLAPSCDYLPDW